MASLPSTVSNQLWTFYGYRLKRILTLLPVLLAVIWIGLYLTQDTPGGVNPVDEITVSTGTADLITTTAALPEITNDNWPWWRGLHGTGIAYDQDIPTSWSTTENVLWQASVPGRGHSTPVVWDNQVFLTTADEEHEKQQILSYDRKNGKLLWKMTAHDGRFMSSHPTNTHASASPACDGERVCAAFINNGALRVTAVDLTGKLVWQSEAGTFGSEHGYGSSPVIYESLIIVLGDNITGSFITAIERTTGKIVWRTQRHTTGKHGSYSTPIVAEVSGRNQLLVHGTKRVTSYNPSNGSTLWYCAGPAEVTACTIAFSDNLVFASGGYPEKELLAIRADGSGDVTDSHVQWRRAKSSDITYVPSPIYQKGRLYSVNDQGIASCFKAEDGTLLWQQRLGSNFSASPTLSGDFLFIPDESGKTYVLKAGTQFEFVSQNVLGDGGFASPIICGNQIFLRSNNQLYCVGKSNS